MGENGAGLTKHGMRDDTQVVPYKKGHLPQIRFGVNDDVQMHPDVLKPTQYGLGTAAACLIDADYAYFVITQSA